MRLFIFATEAEAAATRIRFPNDRVVISGIGLLNALEATLRYGREASEIWNLGLAGALNPTYALGSLHSISYVGKYDPAPHFCPPYTLGPQAARLLSSPFPLHNASLKKILAPHWDLVDMEGYAVVRAARALNKKVHLVKIVSDFASEGGSDLIKQHIEQLGHILHTHLL